MYIFDLCDLYDLYDYVFHTGKSQSQPQEFEDRVELKLPQTFKGMVSKSVFRNHRFGPLTCYGGCRICSLRSHSELEFHHV